MTHTKAVQTIRDAFDDLPDLQDGFPDVKSRLFEMNLASERQHRRGAPNGLTHGISATIAARLFTVSHLLEGWVEPDKWAVDDIVGIRNEVLYAQAYAKRFHGQLTTWAERWMPLFVERDPVTHKTQIDYADLMKARP